MIFALVVFPIVFFILGFIFKLVRPHYTPIEFVLVNIVFINVNVNVIIWQFIIL